ncbi:uncharacterized protein LOC123552434 [Mercenaria mercenaria]|uniref:uncharacterized protein LOC123552434 n=1 Tax=Mercenaria mercenaria TaxID=6596 RepID=UPI00234E37EB|nr:uncharacterized protein LOC123552434 [Mercenaria mercenaria]
MVAAQWAVDTTELYGTVLKTGKMIICKQYETVVLFYITSFFLTLIGGIASSETNDSANTTAASTTTLVPALGVNCTYRPIDWCNTAISGAAECTNNTCQCELGHFQSGINSCTHELDLVLVNLTTSNVTTRSFVISWSQKDNVKDLDLTYDVVADSKYDGGNVNKVPCTVESDRTSTCSSLSPGYKYEIIVKCTYNAIHAVAFAILQESTY